MIVLLRSIVFNILFYGLTALLCLIATPFLFTAHKATLWLVHTYLAFVHFLEKYVVGLDYEVRGLENLPKSGAYLVAAKHQSAYETMKLHRLFHDPAIILKKELLSLPIWGGFLTKLNLIAIDRSSRDSAMKSIIEGALRVKAEQRPIVIFPQGTRVGVRETVQEKPYKLGVARMQEATGLPIVPLALNSGLYWGRNSWLKKPGIVTFEFLPPIPPGQSVQETIRTLEAALEPASASLAQSPAQKRFKQ